MTFVVVPIVDSIHLNVEPIVEMKKNKSERDRERGKKMLQNAQLLNYRSGWCCILFFDFQIKP